MFEKKYSYLAILTVFLWVAGLGAASAQSSSNYQLKGDVIGGCGLVSQSASYENQGTLSQPSTIGASISAQYNLYGGFWYNSSVSPLNYLLTVASTGTGNGTITSDPPGIDCGSDCQEEYPLGTDVVLTAIPDTDSIFTKWTGDYTGTANPLTLTNVTSDMTINANFNQGEADQYTLNVIKSGDGQGTVTASVGNINCGSICFDDYEEATTVILSASPAANSMFAGWSGSNCYGSGQCSVSMTSAMTVNARFISTDNEKNTLTVTTLGTANGTVTSDPAGINCGNGGSNCSAEFDLATLVGLTATPASGASFTGWKGACIGTGPCVVDLDGSKSVTAYFEAISLAVIKSGLGGGRVTSVPEGIDCGDNCKNSFPQDSSVVLTAASDGDSTFTGWSGGDCSGTGNCVVTLTDSKAVRAGFELREQGADLAVSITPGAYQVEAGQNTTYTIVVRNLGPDTADNITVKDILPEGVTYLGSSPSGKFDPETGIWDVGSLNKNDSASLTIAVLVEQDGEIVNTASIMSSSLADKNTDNNTSTATINGSDSGADLAVRKVANKCPAAVGEILSYFINVSNFGPDAALNVTLTDLPPAELSNVQYYFKGADGFTEWPSMAEANLGDIEAGDNLTVCIRGEIASLPADGQLVNTAAVTSDALDANENDNADTDTTEIHGELIEADLAVDLSVDDYNSTMGDQVVISIDVTNNGPDTAAGTKARVLLPPGLTYIEDDSSGHYNSTSGVWDAGDLGTDGETQLNITVRLDKDGLVVCSAAVYADSARDFYPINNYSTVGFGESSLKVDPAIWARFGNNPGSGTTLSPSRPGDGLNDGATAQAPETGKTRLEYGEMENVTLIMVNNGSNDASGVVVQVALPEGLEITSANPHSGCFDEALLQWHPTDAGICGRDSLVRQGDQYQLDLVLTCTAAEGLQKAAISASIVAQDGNDADLTNNSSILIVNPTDPFILDLVLIVQADRSEAETQEITVVTVSVRNSGPDTASGIKVAITLPPEMAFIAAEPETGRYDQESGIWTIGVLNPFENTKLYLTASATTPSETVFRAALDSLAEVDVIDSNNQGQATVTIRDGGTSHGGSGGGGCSGLALASDQNHARKYSAIFDPFGIVFLIMALLVHIARRVKGNRRG